MPMVDEKGDELLISYDVNEHKVKNFVADEDASQKPVVSQKASKSYMGKKKEVTLLLKSIPCPPLPFLQKFKENAKEGKY